MKHRSSLSLAVARVLVLGLAASLAACSSTSGGNDPGPAADDATPDVQGDVPAGDTSPDSPQGTDLAEVPPQDLPAADVPDGVADAADLGPEEAVERPFPPVVPGPPAHLYDCTYDPVTFPGHVSPVPMDCVVDPACTQKMITAHRGAGGDYSVMAPQNTLSAIRAGIVMGVDAVELDVRKTLDGHFVIMHDATVDKTTDGTGNIGDMTLAQIRALHPKLDNVQAEGDFSCDRVPTFEEALDLTKDRVWVYLDTKTDDVANLIPIIRDKGMLDQVIIASGGTGKAIAARAADANARVLVWLGSMDEVRQALVDVVPPPDIIEVLPDSASLAAELLHPKGIKVAVDAFAMDLAYYVDDDASGFDALFAAGVDSVQVEFPPLILKHLGRYAY